MSQYDIDTLEHESGLRPLGEYRDHCTRCEHAAECRERAKNCDHEDQISHAAFGYGVIATMCANCGTSL